MRLGSLVYAPLFSMCVGWGLRLSQRISTFSGDSGYSWVIVQYYYYTMVYHMSARSRLCRNEASVN